MTNTDSDAVPWTSIPAISLRENERGVQIGSGWDPQWHQPTDVYATYSDKDFRLGLNAAQTTLGAVARADRRDDQEIGRARPTGAAVHAQSRREVKRRALIPARSRARCGRPSSRRGVVEIVSPSPVPP